MAMDGRYDRTVTAMTDSDLCYLEREDMPELMRKFPVLKAQLKQFAGMRDRSVSLLSSLQDAQFHHLASCVAFACLFAYKRNRSDLSATTSTLLRCVVVVVAVERFGT